MINVNELRVGNFIAGEGGYFNVVNSISYQGKNKCLINGKFEDSFIPISLTRDILLKCGFEEVGMYDNVYHLGNFRIHLGKKFGEGLLKCEKGNNYLEIEISSVHQLQNLYFALTGKELNIEL